MIPALIAFVHILGAANAVAALLTARTAQGTLAWVVALVAFPWLAIPAYWLFGSPRFEGYVSARRGGDSRLREAMAPAIGAIEPFRASVPEERGGITALERLARLPILRGNRTTLLLDGEATFASLFEGIEAAQRCIVVQFYTIRDDRIGGELARRLMARAREGISIRLLYDRIGSVSLPGSWIRELEESGVVVHGFRSTRLGKLGRLQINFRNHRKIVVVDGRVAWVGGLNVGDEYLGRDPRYGPWRDTHLRVEGPAALALQLAFMEDWHWASGKVPELPWEPVPAGRGGLVASGAGGAAGTDVTVSFTTGDAARPVTDSAVGPAADEPVLILPSGPADAVSTAGLLVQLAIQTAVDRLWITSPYFVPDEAVLEGLKLASFRGVDVRILLPERSDSRLVDLAAYPPLEALLRAGVRMYRYQGGFLHAKTVVVDELAAGVGTVNIDNRSFRLNFEITAILFDRGAIAAVAEAFEADLEVSRELSAEEVRDRPFLARLASRVAYLMAPVL
jgi:cardiolipin synthase A/B